MIVLALRPVWALARLLSHFSYTAEILADHLLFATVRCASMPERRVPPPALLIA